MRLNQVVRIVLAIGVISPLVTQIVHLRLTLLQTLATGQQE